MSHLDYQPSESVFITASDGIKLATDIYLPQGTGKKTFGTVLVRLPYGKREAVAFLPGVAEMLSERGWALVTQDVRGKYDSDGELEPFVHEIADGLATLNWIEKQSWSNGVVVPAGDSYFGYTAWAAAASGHDSVRGLMVRVTSPLVSRDWFYRQGVFMNAHMTEWVSSTWMGSEWVMTELDWSLNDSAKIIEHSCNGRSSKDLRDWTTNAPSSKYWKKSDIDYRTALKRPLVVAHVGGWWDIFQRGQLQTWRDSLGMNTGIHLLRMDAVDHVLDPLTKPHTPIIDIMADPDLRWKSLGSELAPLFEVLSLVESGTKPENSERVVWRPGLGDWQSGDTWPPINSTSKLFYPVDSSQAFTSAQGGLLAHSSAWSGKISWHHNPKNPVPTLETDIWRPLLSGANQTENHERNDVATFSTHPLEAQLSIAGHIQFTANFGASNDVAQVVINLSHVWPDGTAVSIADGTALIHGAKSAPSVTIDLGDLAYEVPPGGQLRLSIAGSNYPKYQIVSGDAFSGFDQWMIIDDSAVLSISVL